MRALVVLMFTILVIPKTSLGREYAEFRSVDALNVVVMPANADGVKQLLHAGEPSGRRRVLASEYHERVVKSLVPLLFGEVAGFDMSGAASWGTNLYESMIGPGTSYYDIKFNAKDERSTAFGVTCAVAFHREYVLLSRCSSGIMGIKFSQGSSAESGSVSNDIAFSRKAISEQMQLAD